jgi:hypothetical protein
VKQNPQYGNDTHIFVNKTDSSGKTVFTSLNSEGANLHIIDCQILSAVLRSRPPIKVFKGNKKQHENEKKNKNGRGKGAGKNYNGKRLKGGGSGNRRKGKGGGKVAGGGKSGLTTAATPINNECERNYFFKTDYLSVKRLPLFKYD